MATLKTTYLGKLRTEIEHLQSGNKIMTDAPSDNNGNGEYISPTDMLAAALGSCMLTIMGMTAKNNGFSIEGTTIETTKIMGTDPRRVAELHLTFNFPQDYTDTQKRMLENAMRSCPVEYSLHPDIKRVLKFTYGGK